MTCGVSEEERLITKGKNIRVTCPGQQQGVFGGGPQNYWPLQQSNIVVFESGNGKEWLEIVLADRLLVDNEPNESDSSGTVVGRHGV